jgi:serine/threonine-protein phosphatase 2B regulatory subunit
MGQGPSTLSDDELDAIRYGTPFSKAEITKLYTRFKEIDHDGSASISAEEFQQIPELSMNPLASRIIEVFDEDGVNAVDFKQFVHNLAVFSKKTKRDDKLSFAFRIFDVAGDGYIDSEELFIIVKLMVGKNLTDSAIQDLVEKTILEADGDKDGVLSWEEFKRALAFVDVEKILTIDF